MERAWERGEVDRAASLASTIAEREAGGRDEVLWHLQAGRTLQAAGDFAASREAFAEAERRAQDWDDRMGALAAREVAAALTNLQSLPYRATPADRVMLQTYQALNFLHEGEIAEARVILNRLQNQQQEIQRQNSRRIDAERERIRTEATRVEESRDSRPFDPSRAASDDRFQRQMERAYQPLREMEAYADFFNPVALYLEALFFLHRPQIPADLERARFALRRVRGMVPGHPVLEADAETLAGILRGEEREPLVYVLLETGLAPEKREVRLDFPLYLFSGEVPYVGAAFPQLHFRVNYDRKLVVRGGAQEVETSLLADMDRIIGTEFERELPLIITKTLASSGIKAAAVYTVRRAVRSESETMAGLVNLFGLLYQYSMNRADLRSWTTLPKQWQIARISRPPDGVLELIRPDTNKTWKLDLPDGVVILVRVQLPSRQASPITNTLILR
ncbi:MAG: hypothetical protein JJT75_12970 [Opitutales bacterium]|nr:hypothetical protein [Opitutales bacterium]MCH8540162.1 hypothetical protein [Opitutales bacterium]